MGQFRDRMDEELRIRGYSTSTRECYVRCVRNFVRHFMRPPDQLTLEHIRQYQLHLTRERHVAWTYFNQVVYALRFFYREVLKADREVRHIPYQKTGRTLPEILSPAEAAALFKATGNLKHRTLLMTRYSGGLRAPEVTRRRLYLEAMGTILPEAKALYIVDGAQKALVPWLPLESGGTPAAGGKQP